MQIDCKHFPNMTSIRVEKKSVVVKNFRTIIFSKPHCTKVSDLLEFFDIFLRLSLRKYYIIYTMKF